MSKINTGGPAFPHVFEIEAGSNDPILERQVDTRQQHIFAGATLRDYFAAKASADDIKHQGEILRTSLPVPILPDNWRATARYMHADAMLKAREAQC